MKSKTKNAKQVVNSKAIIDCVTSVFFVFDKPAIGTEHMWSFCAKILGTDLHSSGSILVCAEPRIKF
jgi:hypothetical protein